MQNNAKEKGNKYDISDFALTNHVMQNAFLLVEYSFEHLKSLYYKINEFFMLGRCFPVPPFLFRFVLKDRNASNRSVPSVLTMGQNGTMER